MTNIEEQASREIFTALIENYSCVGLIHDSIHLYEIRTREGGIVKNRVVFREDKVKNMPVDLERNTSVAFFVDIEFKNIEFMQIFEVSGVSL